MLSLKDCNIIALTDKAEIIARDKTGLFLSISKEHIARDFGDWIEIFIKNDSELGQKLKKGS